MKRILFLLLAALVWANLTGCAANPLPQRAADGLPWNDGWVTVGNIVGVDTPAGLTPQENSDTLSVRGMYYAAWSIGEAVPYSNEDGEEAQLYDAQVYLLLAGYDAAEKAEDSAAEWLAMAGEQYAVGSTDTQTYNGQEFTVITYSYTSETNPYACGASAFGVYRNYAVSVEVSCQEDAGINPQSVLASFLQNCHYAT